MGGGHFQGHMAKFWLQASALFKVKDIIKNKTLLIEQLDEKIEKATLLRKRAQATLPTYQEQLTTGIARLKEMFPKYEPSLIREVRIADNPEKKERALRHLNDIRRMLDLPPIDLDNASDDPKID